VQRYRAQATYTPRAWLNLGANFNIVEQRNHTSDINYAMHNRNFGVNAVVAPQEKFSFDFAYNYSAYLQNNNICYIGTVVAAGSFTCTFDDSLLEVLGNYTNHTHFGEFSLMFKLVHRVMVRVGYSITDVNGSTLILDPLEPLGPLASRFQQPLGAIDVEAISLPCQEGGSSRRRSCERELSGLHLRGRTASLSEQHSCKAGAHQEK
jgi:hypothetical protein